MSSRNREKFGYSTYRYYYTGNFSNISPLPWIGATHSGMLAILTYRLKLFFVLTRLTAELPLLFGTHYLYRGNSTGFEWQTSYGMEG